MSQASLLVDTLKKGLHQRRLTYANVAHTLRLSESSVKRLFGQKNPSLERVEQICQLMKIELTDLLEMMHAAQPRITQLTEEQEKVLVNEPKVLLVGILAISFWTATDILETFRISRTELVRLLVRLDRMRIIDLLPHNVIKVRLARNFAWRKDGPIQRFFEERMQRQFFETSFSRDGELRTVAFGSLSRRSNELLQQRLQKMAEEFESLVQEDKSLGHQMRSATTMILAIRPWEPAQFTELRRRNGDAPAKTERQSAKR
jgi:DNA-binding Xre family transcriptional regulator